MKSQAERRHESFVEAGEQAMEHADRALRDIDAVLAEEDQLLEGLQAAVAYGTLTHDEADECFRAYVGSRTSGGDPLAPPLEDLVWPS